MAWPTTDDPRTEFATVRFTRTEADEIDALIPDPYPNRSAFLRAAADAEVARQRKTRAKQARTRASTRAGAAQKAAQKAAQQEVAP